MEGGSSVVVIAIAFLAFFGHSCDSAHPCDITEDYNKWSNAPIKKEVVIVGGGVAGLTALKTFLMNRVSSVILLEAQDYFGGRVKTHRQDNGKIVTEDAAEWINGGFFNPLYNLAESLDALSPPKSNSDYNWTAVTQWGKKADARGYDTAAKLMLICERNDVQKKFYGYGYGKCYNSKFSKIYNKKQARPSEKSAWKNFTETWVLKDTGLVDWMDQSMKDADHFTDWGYDQWDQWKDGFDTVVKYIMKDIAVSKLKKSTPVCKIFYNEKYKDNKALVVTKDGVAYEADYVIFTPSIGHLKERHSSIFRPTLLKTYRDSMDKVELGLCNKVQLGWDSAWWGEKRLNQVIIFTDTLPKEMSWLYGIMEFLTIHQQDKMLQAFVTGKHAKAMEKLPEDTVKQHLVWHLGNTTGFAVPEPTFFRRSKWHSNVWMRGSYNSYGTLAGNIANRDPLKKSIPKTNTRPLILWAGEHTSNKRYGTVDGAMAEGEARAFKVIDDMDEVYGKRR